MHRQSQASAHDRPHEENTATVQQFLPVIRSPQSRLVEHLLEGGSVGSALGLETESADQAELQLHGGTGGRLKKFVKVKRAKVASGGHDIGGI
jgi:hypothetical protein